MRALLDENIHVGLAQELHPQIDAITVRQQGWTGIENGELLQLAEAEFDLFITMDRGIEFQQHLAQFNISIMLLRAPSNRLADLLPLVPLIHQALPRLRAGAVTHVTS